jgi:hypothetical protein
MYFFNSVCKCISNIKANGVCITAQPCTTTKQSVNFLRQSSLMDVETEWHTNDLFRRSFSKTGTCTITAAAIDFPDKKEKLK